MIKKVVICDRCEKTIPEDEKIGYVSVFQRAEPLGEFIGENEFTDMDFCEECLCEITKFVALKSKLLEVPKLAIATKLIKSQNVKIIPTIDKKIHTEANVHEQANDARKEIDEKTDMAAVPPEESKKEVAPAQSRRTIDYGKIKALADAGWPAAKIADEMGMTPQAVYDAKYKIKNGKVEI